MLMVKAGDIVDKMIGQLLPHLEAGDIVIDGGNSLFTDSNRRTKDLAAKGILFVGAGVSGGEEGARRGPSIMPGGNPAAWPHLPGHRRQGRGWDSLLRLGGRKWRRALRQDGPQRH